MIKMNYTTDENRAEVISSMTGKILVGDAIHIDENYLLFISAEEVEPYVLELEVVGPSELDLLREQLQTTQAAVDFLLLSQMPQI